VGRALLLGPASGHSGRRDTAGDGAAGDGTPGDGPLQDLPCRVDFPIWEASAVDGNTGNVEPA